MSHPKTNTWKESGTYAIVDVSTTKLPNASATVDLSRITDIIDGNGRWFAFSPNKKALRVYACRHERRDGKRIFVSMHRHLFSHPVGFVIDHRDNCGLNNTSENIRLATHSENMRNRTSAIGSTSKYLGVSAYRGQWQAGIKSSGKHRRIGVFGTEEEAAHAYNIVAKQEHGDFARLNEVQS